MTRIHFVGDGDRDRASLPGLVGSILKDRLGREIHFASTFARWARLHGAGLRKKLMFAVVQAGDARAQALVAAIDRDRAPTRDRLRDLVAAREQIRETNLMPLALGEAVPHGEAWVLADPEAVRSALGLDPGVIPDIAARSPKAELERLHRVARERRNHALSFLEFLARASSRVRVTVVAQRENGFKAFAKEVRHEIGPVVNAG